MLEFKRIELEDRAWAEPLLAAGNLRGSEYAFSNNFIYRKLYRIEVARMDGYYLVHSARTPEEASYLFPAGSGELGPVIDALVEDAERRGNPFRMHGVPREGMERMEALFPGRFAFAENRDSFDYLYESERLITLSGKKLHAKRNFINRFLAEHEGDWSFEDLSAANLDEAWRMNERWCAEMGCGRDPGLMEEACAVRNCFQYFHALGLCGGLLRAGGEVVAFTMGRPLCADTFIVHIEKAFPQVAGAYPMVNQQFAARRCAGFQYVNREDDVGDEGLRRAKLSYRPDILLEKFTAALN